MNYAKLYYINPASMVCHPPIVINICVPHSRHLFPGVEVCYFPGEQPELTKYGFRKRKSGRERKRERLRGREREREKERKKERERERETERETERQRN